VLAAIRPDSWNTALFLHVLGGMVLVGPLGAGAVALLASSWDGEHPLATARRIGNRQVFLAGWRPHEQLPQALNAADALVLPSVAEAFGLVLVEAMACGLPVIASRAHGPAAIVADGSTGWLIPPDDEDALVDALVAAANGHQERRARGRRAQTASRQYDRAEIAARIASLYEELLVSPPSQQVARDRRA
jgi:glycosyltransferase involved in cell wall biosynthesis